MTTTTQGEHAQTAPGYEHQRAIMEGERNASLDSYSRVVYLTSAESRLYEAAFTNGWDRHAAQVAALTPSQPAAPQGGAEAPKVYLSVNQLLQAIEFATGGAPANADELETSIGFQIGHSQDDDGKVIHGMRCWLADYPEEGVYPLDEEPTAKDLAAHALRASHGQAPAGATPWRSAVLDLIDECPGLTMEQDHWLSRRVKELEFASAPRPAAQAAPAAGAVTGSAEPTQEMIAAILRLVDLGQSDPEDHRYDDGSKLATQICRAVLAAAAQAAPVHELDAVIAECEHGLPFDATSLATLKRVRDTLAAARAPAECGNCFEGKSDFDHVCKHCGGSGKVADSVLEDAARYRWLRRWKGQEHEPLFTVQHEVDGTLWGGDLDAAVDAARKQGANHDNT